MHAEKFYFIATLLLPSLLFVVALDPLCDGYPEDEFIFIPHEYNCTLYYVCLNGNKSIEICKDDLYFNPTTDSCDFPDVSGCENIVTTTTVPTTTPAPTTVSTLPPDPLCEGLGSNQHFYFPHENNCSLFYQCYNGQKELQSCLGGLYFNAKTEQCTVPESSGCKQADLTCVGITIDYFPHPTDCSKYIECYMEDSYLMVCPGNYYFDPDRKACVPPEQSSCGKTTTSLAPTWTTPHPICWGVRPNITIFFPFEDDCHKYYKCVGADLTEETCGENFYFDPDRQMCDFPDNVDCQEGITRTTENPKPTGVPDDPRCSAGGTSFWPHPVDCEKYIQCMDGHSFEMTCPNGLYFNPETETCVIPSLSSCGKVPTTSTVPASTTTKEPGWTNNPECPWPAVGDSYLMPYPGDCTKFYECAEGEKVVMNCPPTLWFNPVLKVCDYPYQAGCEYSLVK